MGAGTGFALRKKSDVRLDHLSPMKRHSVTSKSLIVADLGGFKFLGTDFLRCLTRVRRIVSILETQPLG